MSVRIYLDSIGCKLNQCERDTLAQQFAQAGYQVVAQAKDADVCIVNTCAVTHVAERKSRHIFRYLHRLNPSARLVAIGCYAGIEENGIQADLIVPNEHKSDLVSLIEAALNGWQLSRRRYSTPDAQATAGAAMLRTRPLVKIQDGCDNNCAYCLVRVLRGRQRSRPPTDILAQVAQLTQQGYREVVLTGVHIGSYGRENGVHCDLTGLIKDILAQPTAPERLRLSSIEPWDVDADFLSLWQNPRLCRHLHLPLQSGCDATLARMNRHYTTAHFASLMARAREAIPGLAVTTDVIVGLPGETETEFATSLAFVGQMAFARIHVFPYSPRPGTPAASMPDQIDPAVRRQRAQQMAETARQSSLAFRQQFIGQTLPVLWEAPGSDGCWSGLTDNYIRVWANTDQDLTNTLHPARLIALEASGMRAAVCAANCGATCAMN